jgi:hypothetical protein
MQPVSRLPDAAIHPGTPFADAFLAHGAATFRQACEWVKALPYGASSRLDDPMVLFADRSGTCAAKHDAIVGLAAELGLDVHKNLGFYRLTDEIITGVAGLLRPHGLDFVPSAHCFLEHGAVWIDLTAGNCTGKNNDLDQFDLVIPVPPGASRAELAVHYDRCFAAYAEIEPRLAALGQEAVRTLVQQCHQLAACRRLELPQHAAAAASGT